jgi:response regulator of citrate/malate metabolism
MIGDKRVLVVEDDPTIYPILVRMIQRLNPRVDVEFAVSAEGAEDLLRGLRQKYDVIVSDVGLAGKKTGVDLVNDCYFEIGPVPFVLTSANREFKSRLPFLPKPFRYEDLYEKLAPFLDANAPNEAERTGKIEMDRAAPKVRFQWMIFGMAALFAVTFYLLLSGDMGHLRLLPWLAR